MCLGVVLSTDSLKAIETCKQEVLVNLVIRAVELARPESSAETLPQPAVPQRPGRGHCCLCLFCFHLRS